MLTRDQVLHIAKLANLQLSKEEVEKFRKQLSETLDYVAILDELDTSGVEPTSQVTGLENVVREDRVGECLKETEALSGAKAKEKSYFKVKGIFDAKDT